MARWQVNVVRINNTHTAIERVCSIPTAQIKEHVRRLNGVDDVIVDCSLFDPGLITYGLDQSMVMRYEGEVWRNGVRVCAGPILVCNCDLDTGRVELQIVSWMHYFHRRYFGRADRNNAVTNGGFDVDFTGWSDFGTGLTSKVIDTVVFAEGTGSAKLTGRSNHTGGIEQVFAPFSHNFAPGLVAYFNFEFQLDPAANVNFGRLPGTGTVIAEMVLTWTGGTFTQTINLPSGFGTGAFGRITSGVFLAAGIVYTLTLRLYAVDGICWWDAGQVYFDDSTSVNYPGEDQSVLFTNILNYAQDPAGGKSPLLVTVDAPATGVNIFTGYAHSLHENIGDALVGLTKRVNGFDLEADHATRTLHVRYPERGSLLPRWNLTLGRNIAGGSVRAEGSQIETSHVVLGQPQLSEEGGAVDTSNYNGLILEGITRAPVSTALRDLDFLAQEALRQRSGPAITTTLRINGRSGDIAAGVGPGDSLPVLIDRGVAQLDTTLRVVDITEKPVEGSVTMDFTTAAAA